MASDLTMNRPLRRWEPGDISAEGKQLWYSVKRAAGDIVRPRRTPQEQRLAKLRAMVLRLPEDERQELMIELGLLTKQGD